MKVSVEVSDSELQEILELTGELKKGPAIRRLMEQALQLRRRQRVELAGYEQAQELERQRLQHRAA